MKQDGMCLSFLIREKKKKKSEDKMKQIYLLKEGFWKGFCLKHWLTKFESEPHKVNAKRIMQGQCIFPAFISAIWAGSDMLKPLFSFSVK